MRSSIPGEGTLSFSTGYTGAQGLSGKPTWTRSPNSWWSKPEAQLLPLGPRLLSVPGPSPVQLNSENSTRELYGTRRVRVIKLSFCHPILPAALMDHHGAH